MSFLFRKRRSAGGEQGRLPTPAGIQSMDESLQKKFSKGIQFNIKILLRGDRNTGKTCLFQRMQGKAFTEAYIPTNEIQVTSILWSYRVTNDTVKVEVWDIVDKGKAQKKTGKSLLKMFNEPTAEADPSDIPLDAEFMDVYKGAHGVVFTYDITKQWTWKYVEREVPRVPLHIPIIVLGNFRDMGDHRVISSDEATLFLRGLSRPEGAAPVRYAECSMKNGYGLTHLHKFLSVPFLQLQQEMLLQQLQVNREQTLAAQEELDSAGKSEDQNYEMFLEKIQRLTEERKRKTDHLPQQDHTPSTGGDSPSTPSSRRNTLERTQEDTPTSPVGVANPPQRSGSSKLFSGWFSRSKEEAKSEETIPAVKSRQAEMTIDDFVPEGGEVDSFLEDSEEGSEEEEDSEEDSDEPDAGNPQVAMDEDLSSPEEEPPPKIMPLVQTETPPTKRPPAVKKNLRSAKEIVLTESEDESEGPTVMEDEDVSLEGLAISKPPAKSLDELFEVPQKKAAKTKKKKATNEEKIEPTVVKPPKKSGGLLLEFSPSSTPAKQPTPPETESPEVSRRDSKRKKKSKKRKELKEVEVAKSEETSAPSNDPFGAIASLDAWLNSDSAAKKNDGRSTGGVIKTVEVAEEADSAEEHRERENKPKKHKRRPREEGEERTRKKKHKHKSSTRHRTEEEDRDYDAL